MTLPRRPRAASSAGPGGRGRRHVEAGQLPLALERLAQAAEVARRRREVGLLDLDVVEADDRVDLDRMRVGLLAHDLPVHLALGRHVDHELALDAARCSRAGGRRARPLSAA